MLKHKKLWLVLTIVLAVLMIVMFVAYGVIMGAGYDTSINSYLGIKTSTTEGGSDAQYFTSDYESQEALEEYEDYLCQQLEAEGAALLKNDSNALPLSSGANVSLFSQSSYDFIYGGTGSGAVKTDTALTLSDALTAEGFNVNSDLRVLYRKAKYSRVNAQATGGYSKDYRINEMPVSTITSAVEGTFSSYGDAAIITLARSGGEGSDLPNGTSLQAGEGYDGDLKDGDYLVLNDTEREMLEYVKGYKDQGVFKKIIVLLNSSNSLQLDFIDDSKYGIDAVLWVGDVGQSGISSVAGILSGRINPSGRIVDTFLMDNQSGPAMVNFGNFEYSNASDLNMGTAQNNQDSGITKLNSRYVVYQEGIYVGYRYYETRYEDYVLGQGNSGSWSYADDVKYPFGSGMSYTTASGSWDYSDFSMEEKDDSFDFTIKVTNNTGYPGKHTVQIYMQSPYTQYDKDNGVEKASVELVGFAKTQELANGADETLSISVNKSEMASYDSNAAKTYIVDPGTYYFTAGMDAHDAVNNILAQKAADNITAYGRMDAAGNTDMVAKHTESLDSNSGNVYTKNSESVNLTYSTSSAYYGNDSDFAITNQFDNADLSKYTGANHSITYLSRSDWTNTWPQAQTNFACTEQMWEDGLAEDSSQVGPDGTTAGSTARAALVEKGKEEFSANYKEEYGVSEITMPATGAKLTRTNDETGEEEEYTMPLIHMKGKDYSDPEWETLLSQATYAEMIYVIYNGFRQTAAIESIAMPATIDYNGPQGFTNALSGSESGMAYTSEDVMAATFNTELVTEMGKCMGEDFLAHDVAGIYGPGGNTHRTPYSGRNFEYYSEDGYLASVMAAYEVRAIQSKGVYVFLKHCVLNDQENGRYGLSTFSNEQAIREIYLRPFEGAIVGGGSSGVMTSFNRIGVVWSGADYNLMTNVLRKEFGMAGAAITDCTMFGTPFDYRLGVLAGQNLWDGMSAGMAQLDGLDDDAVMVTAVRESTKRIAYTIVNSLAMNGMDEGSTVRNITPWWQVLILTLGSVFAVLAVAGAVLTILSFRAGKKGSSGMSTDASSASDETKQP